MISMQLAAILSSTVDTVPTVKNGVPYETPAHGFFHAPPQAQHSRQG